MYSLFGQKADGVWTQSPPSKLSEASCAFETAWLPQPSRTAHCPSSGRAVRSGGDEGGSRRRDWARGRRGERSAGRGAGAQRVETQVWRRRRNCFSGAGQASNDRLLSYGRGDVCGAWHQHGMAPGGAASDRITSHRGQPSGGSGHDWHAVYVKLAAATGLRRIEQSAVPRA